MTETKFHYELIKLQEILMKFAFKLTTDKEDAKDLVQETFLKALKYCNKFVNDSNFKAWTFTIMKNTFINNYRRLANHKTSISPMKETFSMNYINYSDSLSPYSYYASMELENTIESLKDELKIPIKMHQNGFLYKEIAESLDMRLGTVKSRIFIARKQLRYHLDRQSLKPILTNLELSRK